MGISRLALALLAAAGGLFGAGIEAAWGGAWLMPPGDGQVIADTFFSDSTRAFDANGHLIPVPAYRKFELGTYIGYGLTDWLTLVASPSFDRIRNPPPGQSYNGPGESEIAATVGLFRTDTSVLSFQAGLRSPGFSFADSLGPHSEPACARKGEDGNHRCRDRRFEGQARYCGSSEWRGVQGEPGCRRS